MEGEKPESMGSEETLIKILGALPDVGEILTELYHKMSIDVNEKGRLFNNILDWIIGANPNDVQKVRDTLEKNFDHILKEPKYLEEVLLEHANKRRRIIEGEREEQKKSTFESESPSDEDVLPKGMKKEEPSPSEEPKQDEVILKVENFLKQGKVYEAKQEIEEVLKKNRNSQIAIELDYRVQKAIEERQGPSAHTTTDRWAEKDTLGYWVYIETIGQFLIHKETKSPLSISVQAPWGGGKTTVMRLVQEKLDPKEYERTLKEVKGIVEPKKDENIVKILLKDLVEQLELSSEKNINFGIEENQRLTVWFNAWKYDNTKEVWAGLATAIIKQLTSRLEPEQQEQLWLLINKERADAQGITKQIRERKFSAWMNNLKTEMWKPAAALFASAMTGFFAIPSILPFDASGLAGVLGMIGSITWGYKKAMKEKAEIDTRIDEEPANAMFKNYIEIPDYTEEVGFVHHVDDDLRRILRIIKTKYDNPIIIFIDDLDRCSPRKIADVIEALNRFLSAEFPGCIFLLAIDAEMVAASLEEAHKDVIAKLPRHARMTPIGWRFMDKFIQLPVIIPPPEKNDRDFYLETLISKNITTSESDSGALPADGMVIRDVQNNEKSNPIRYSDLVKKYELDRKYTIAATQNEVMDYSDDNEIIRNLIKKDEEHFSDNPREIKRFVNLYRFFFFLRTLRKARKERHSELSLATDSQIAKWIILTLKWPSALRWILRSAGETAYKGKIRLPTSTPKERLYLLETMANKESVKTWQEKLTQILEIKEEDNVTWISEKSFRLFMKNANLSKAENVGFY